jgi:hypothetical protein
MTLLWTMDRHPDTPDVGDRPVDRTISLPSSRTAGRSDRVDPTRQFLAHAAAAAARDGIELETFMDAAWSAFVDARPGLRDILDQLQVVAHLERMRQEGKLGQS